MSVMSMCGIGFVCVCAMIIVRENGYKSFSVVISCMCALLILIYALSAVTGEYEELRSILYNKTNIRYVDVVTKAFGTAFVCEICSDFIRELGSESIAKGLETAGKAEILFLCISPMKEIITMAVFLAGQA